MTSCYELRIVFAVGLDLRRRTFRRRLGLGPGRLQTIAVCGSHTEAVAGMVAIAGVAVVTVLGRGRAQKYGPGKTAEVCTPSRLVVSPI